MPLSSKAATLLVLTAIIAIAPVFFPSSYYFRVGSLIFVNGLAVTGLVILIGYAGQVSLGHAGFAGIGAYYFGNKTAALAHAGPMKLFMWGLIIAHIGGALVHQFYWKTDVMRRMTRGVSSPL